MTHIQTSTLAALAALALCSCAVQRPAPRDADLVFRLGASSSMGRAIAAATDRGEGPVVHVGIYAVVGGEPSVIEADPESGVTVTPWAEFAGEGSGDGAALSVKVMRVDDIDAGAVVARALSYVGRPYDYAYLPGDDALYCSELVQVCYMDSTGNPVFESTPMNFLAPDGTLPDYWRQLYGRLGMEVPQGVPGTNPAAMSASPRLKFVLAF